MDTLPETTHLPPDPDAHPLVRAAAALAPQLRAHREAIERDQRIPAALFDQLSAAGLYRLTIPRSLGGLEIDPVTFSQVVETLSRAVASVGWNIANNACNTLMVLGLPDAGIREVFADGPGVVVAGTGVEVGGIATPVQGGYRVTGKWSFGSGCHEANWMVASFRVKDGGPAAWRAVFPKSDATIVPGSWQVAGMRGTGSFDWTVNDVFVPAYRTIDHTIAPLDNQWSRWPGITYALPSCAWLGPHHSSVITGIALAGFDALVDLAAAKTPRGRSGLLRDNPQVQDAVGRADAILHAGRAHRTAMIRQLWDTLASGAEITLEQRARCRLAAVHAGDCARDAMDLVYRQGGTTSFKVDSRLAECWRDLHVVGQTGNIAPEWYPIGGRVLLGMDPGPRMK
jgi:alkylation response protein AidB-like acyl-CoA dehydrogenase